MSYIPVLCKVVSKHSKDEHYVIDVTSYNGSPSKRECLKHVESVMKDPNVRMCKITDILNTSKVYCVEQRLVV